MARDEFPYEWDVIENEWITMSDAAAFRRVSGILRQINRFLQIFETQPYRKRDGMRWKR